MAARNFYIISYDVSDDRRRTKVAKAMEDFGTRVQYSVFECRLFETELKKLKKRVEPLIKKPTDSLRIYFLDAASIPKIEVIGKGEVTADKPYFIH